MASGIRIASGLELPPQLRAVIEIAQVERRYMTGYDIFLIASSL